MEELGIEMKDKAILYLSINPLLHMGMIEPIRSDTADILYAETDGVLIKEQKSHAYMISVSNFEKGKELIDGILECSLIVVHQKFLVDYISSRFGLTKKMACFQAVYMNKDKIDYQEKLEISCLKEDQMALILQHYHHLSISEIQTLLRSGNLFGGYKDGTLVGFIGKHLEGSIGILVVFPQFRRLGYGTLLECYLVNHMLEQGLIPFAQIEEDNIESINLHKKLGFSISKESLYWMYGKTWNRN